MTLELTAPGRNCPQCGAGLAAAAAEGLCPRCLFGQIGQEAPASEAPSAVQGTDADWAAGERGELGDYELTRAPGQPSRSGDSDTPSPQTATAPSPGTRTESAGAVIGRYKLLEKLGEGGFGVVWAAEQREPVRRRVALKIIKLGMDTRQVVARFEAERQALAMMDHPNIAKVLDAGATETGRPYFVMELVKGIPITTYCGRERLDTAARLDLFIRVCQAIQHAHQKGIIHRDIKPSNILVTLHDGVPVPKVIDFGIAKATQAELTEKTIYTRFDQFIGTPAYMSPEQAELSGLDIDTRSDIYSLGVLLYELLTGTTPFDTRELLQSGLDEMRRIIREREPMRPSTRLTQELSGRKTEISTQSSAIDRDLDWIVMKCLEKDRARRYDTANGLAMDIQRHLNNEPVLARPPSALYRYQKAWHRNKSAFTAVAAVLATLIVGLGLSLWQATVIDRERDRAVASELEAIAQAEAADREQRRAEALERTSRRRAYAADMNLVQRALELNDLGRAKRLLDRYRPAPGKEDLRGWEWRYLWKQVQSDALYSMPSVVGPVYSLVSCPQGSWLAVAGGDQEVSLWDLRSRKKIRSLNRHGGVLDRHSAVFDQTLAGFGYENFAKLAASPTHPWLAVSWVADRLAGHSQIRIVDVTTGANIHRFDLGDEAWVYAMAFTSDGSRLVTLCASRSFVNWHLRSFATSDEHPSVSIPVPSHFQIQAGPFGQSLAVGPDGGHAFIGTADGKVVAYDLTSATPSWTSQLASNTIVCLALSADGRRMAAGTDASDPVIILMDPTDGRELGRLKGHEGWIGRLQFLDTGRFLASSGADQTIRIWDVERGAPIRVLRGHGREVWELIELPGSMLVSASKAGELLVWDPASEAIERSVATRPQLVGIEDQLAFAPDGSAILLAQVPGGQVLQWGGEGFRERKIVRAGRDVRAMLFEPDGWRLAAGLEDGSIECFDLRGTESQVLSCEAGSLFPLAFNVDHSGLWVWCAGKNRIEEWNFGEDGPRRTFPFNNGRRNTCWQAAGRGLLRMTADGGFLFLEEHTGTTVSWQLIGGGGWGGGFSSDLRWFARTHDPGVLTLWDVHEALTGGGPPRLHATLTGALMVYHGVSFTPDCQRVAASSALSQMVTLWDTETFESVLTLPGAGWNVEQIAFSPDENTLISGGDVLHIWTAPTWEEIDAAEAGHPGTETEP